MEQLFSAGKAYLKINSLVKTPLHEFMAVERSGLWAPDGIVDFFELDMWSKPVFCEYFAQELLRKTKKLLEVARTAKSFSKR